MTEWHSRDARSFCKETSKRQTFNSWSEIGIEIKACARDG